MIEPEPPRAAGIVSRGVAAVVDLGVVLVVIGLMYVGLVLTRLVLNPSAFTFPNVSVLFSTSVTFFVAVLYLAGCWAVSGCTAGAVLMGLRVVSRRAPDCPFWSRCCGRRPASSSPSG